MNQTTLYGCCTMWGWRSEGDHAIEIGIDFHHPHRSHLRQDMRQFVGVWEVQNLDRMTATGEFCLQPVDDEPSPTKYERYGGRDQAYPHVPASEARGRAGTPPTRAFAGTSRTTAEPAPTTAPAPMRIRGRTALPTPTSAHSPTSTFPAKVHPGATCAPAPITPSWSIVAAVLRMARNPMEVSVPTVARAITTAPLSTRALGARKDAGCMTAGRTKPRARNSIPIRKREALSPSATTAVVSPSARKRGKQSSLPITGTPSTLGAAGAGSTIPTISPSRAARTASITTFAWPPPPMIMMRACGLFSFNSV